LNLQKALSWDNEKEFHHIFPRAYLRGKSVPSEEINVIPNIAILSSASNKTISHLSPSEYFKMSRVALGDEFEAVMKSNFISDVAILAAEEDDYRMFLQLRAVEILDAAKALAIGYL